METTSTNKSKSVKQLESDNEIHINPSDILLGKWYDIETSMFANDGALYSSDIRFQVQAASVKTIKYFAAMDENNMLSVKEAVYKLIGTHIRALRGNKVLNSLDVIYEHDQLRAILIVNMYTGTGSKLTAKVLCQGDDALRCNTSNSVDVSLKTLAYQMPSDKGMSFFNSKTGMFTITLTNGKTLDYRPLTLNESIQVIRFTSLKLNAGDPAEKQFTDFAGFFMHSKKDEENMEYIYSKYEKLTSDLSMIAVMTKLSEIDLNIKQKMELLSNCTKCSRLNNKPITELDPIKHIFFNEDTSTEY